MNRTMEKIGSFPIIFAKRQASQRKLRTWNMQKIPCWPRDYGLLFLPHTYATSFKSITSSQLWTKQPKPTYCYEGKRPMKKHGTKQMDIYANDK